MAITHASRMLALALCCASCAAGTARRSETGPARRADYLSTAEIRSEEWRTAYDVVRTLRPQWLRKRGQQSIVGEGDIVVYQDDMPLGGPEQLRDIPAGLVVAMRYYDGPSAQQRWGLDHGYGVIFVETR